MYKILVNEAFIEMEADNVEIQSGTLIFYFDKAKTKVRAVVPAGWKYFEIMEEENALQVQSQSQTEEAVKTYKNKYGKFVEEEEKEESEEAVLEPEKQISGVCV